MKNQEIELFLKDFDLNKDNSDGWWNTHDKIEKWLDGDIKVSILSRAMKGYIPELYAQIFKKQTKSDYLWKKYIATNLLEELKEEWQKEDLSEEFIINELKVTEITFCFYTEGDFCIYFRPKTIDCEHGIILLGDKNENLLRAQIE